jgi:hypothetical protein
VAIQAGGTTRVEQGANQAELHRGDMVVYDSTRPYRITNVDETELHYLQIPRSALSLPQAALDHVLGSRIGVDNNSLATPRRTRPDGGRDRGRPPHLGPAPLRHDVPSRPSRARNDPATTARGVPSIWI